VNSAEYAVVTSGPDLAVAREERVSDPGQPRTDTEP
jgi:hypothetical protein